VSVANIKNDLKSEEEESLNIWVNIKDQSNNFILDENIYAAYLKSNFQIKKWKFSTGLRYESSLTDGYSVTLDELNTREINKLFPSVSLGRSITKDLGFNVNYSYRIERPRYSTLNAFVYYLDPFTYEKGNPFIRPELSHSTKFSLTYQNQRNRSF